MSYAALSSTRARARRGQSVMRTSSDLVIETLADSEAELLELVVDLMIERRALRETLHAAVDRLREVTADRDRVRKSSERVITEYRDFRAGVMRETLGDAAP